MSHSNFSPFDEKLKSCKHLNARDKMRVFNNFQTLCFLG